MDFVSRVEDNLKHLLFKNACMHQEYQFISYLEKGKKKTFSGNVEFDARQLKNV